MSLNKIYSRPRIRFPKSNFNYKNKKQKTKFLILVSLGVILIVFSIFLRAAYPIFISSCETEAASSAVKILNTQVNEAMVSYSYYDLVNIVKDETGEVSYIEAKIVPINSLVSKITDNIQNEIDNMGNITVSMNLGTVSGISSLALISPKINIKLESSGRIETEIESEFEAVRNKSNYT